MTTSNTGLNGTVGFQWVPSSTAPNEPGEYKVALNVAGEVVESKASFNGRNWEFPAGLEFMGRLMSHFLLTARVPLPNANATTSNNTAYNLAPNLRPTTVEERTTVQSENTNTASEVPDMPTIDGDVLALLRAVHRTGSSLSRLDLCQIVWPNRNYSDHAIIQSSTADVRSLGDVAQQAGLLVEVDGVYQISEEGINLVSTVTVDEAAEANESQEEAQF